MKSIATRSLGVLALITALGIAVPATAFASNSTPTSTINGVSTPWATWHASWVSYFDGLKSINATYRASVQGARYAYVSANAMATTKAERRAATATLNASLSIALNTRVAAITAAGDPPAPPAGYNATAFVIGVQAANVAFRVATTSAQAAYSQALDGATTTAQRRLARLSFDAAVGSAIVVRSNALIALGSPPSNPRQPTSPSTSTTP